jgi:hypothetical protein
VPSRLTRPAPDRCDLATLVALGLAGCDELVLSKNEVAKIAAAEASKAVAAEMAKRPAVQPSPVPTPEDIESRDKGRYQIVHPNPAFAAMILLDTATGKTWRRCQNASVGRADLNGWCEMDVLVFIPSDKKAPTPENRK